MSEAPVTTPVATSGPSSSPVNAQSSASQANQQAAAAGEAQGLSNKDQAASEAQATPPTNNQATETAQATEGQASLTPAAYKPSGNDTIDQVTQLLHNSGFDGSTDLINEVVSTQEFSLASKAKLVDELGADVAQLVINNLESSVQAVKAAGEAEGKRLKEYAFKKLGGSDPDSTWAALAQHVQADSSFSADDRKAYNELLHEGGVKAQIAIDTLVGKYSQSAQYKQSPQLMQGDEAIASGFQPMSKREYQEQIGPAIVKYGESSHEVQALRNRRSISMSRGYN